MPSEPAVNLPSLGCCPYQGWAVLLVWAYHADVPGPQEKLWQAAVASTNMKDSGSATLRTDLDSS